MCGNWCHHLEFLILFFLFLTFNTFTHFQCTNWTTFTSNKTVPNICINTFFFFLNTPCLSKNHLKLLFFQFANWEKIFSYFLIYFFFLVFHHPYVWWEFFLLYYFIYYKIFSCVLLLVDRVGSKIRKWVSCVVKTKYY